MSQLVKTIGGLAIASVKTAGGLAIASAKTIGGLDNTSSGGGDPYFSSVSLLLHCNGTDTSQTFTDSSSNNFTQTASGNAQIDTTVKKWGSGSGMFARVVGDYVTTPDNAAFAFGTGDFTIEMWVYITDISLYNFLLDPRAAGGTVSPVLYTNVLDSSKLTFYDGSANQIVGDAFTLNSWTFVALSRVSGTTRMYMGTNQVGSSFTDGNSYVQMPLRIGNHFSNTSLGLYGYLDDFRITKGVGRYSGTTLTEPTGEFPDS